MSAFIGCLHWNRLPTAELERHYLQNGRDNLNSECKCIDCAHTTDYANKCFTKCFVQTTVAPPSGSVGIRNLSLCRLWQSFYRQLPRITILMFVLHKLVNVEKRRSWGFSNIWQFRSHFIIKVACGCLRTILAGCLLRAHSWFGPFFFLRIRATWRSDHVF